MLVPFPYVQHAITTSVLAALLRQNDLLEHQDVSVPSPAKLRNFLGWAFVISIALHLALLPIVGRSRPLPAAPEPHRDILFTFTIPTPPPHPRPTPRPMPRAPLPARTHPTQSAARPLAHAPQIHHELSHQAVSAALVPEPAGTDGSATAGAGGGVSEGPGDASSAGTGSAATPSPTPKASCAQPHVDAAVTRAVEPDYPELARQQGLTGTTQVKVTLAETGTVVDAQVYASSGSPALDAAAIAAAKRSIYTPEIDDCRQHAGSYLFRAEFSAQ
jgi:protein TonB